MAAGRILTELPVIVRHLDFYQLYWTRGGSGVNHFIRYQLSCTTFYTSIDLSFPEHILNERAFNCNVIYMNCQLRIYVFR